MTPTNPNVKELTPMVTPTTPTSTKVTPTDFDVHKLTWCQENDPDIELAALEIKQRTGIEKGKDWIARKDWKNPVQTRLMALSMSVRSIVVFHSHNSQKGQLIINHTNDGANWLRMIEVPITNSLIIFCEQILVHISYLPTETMNASSRPWSHQISPNPSDRFQPAAGWTGKVWSGKGKPEVSC